MATLNIKLTSPGVIDNATIYLEDPSERIPIFFNPINDSEWKCENVRVPIQGSLELSLYVLGFSGKNLNVKSQGHQILKLST